MSSPNRSADDYNLGTIKLGNDKGKWIVIEAKNKIKQWYKLKGKVKNYITHDNGSRPFRVVVTDNKIIIFKSTVLFETDKKLQNKMFNNKIIFDPWSSCMIISKFKNVFIGKHSNKYIPSGSSSDLAQGNTILIELSRLTYLVIVANVIQQFKTLEKINKYFSPVGPNDSPYPFALTDNYAYLIGEEHYLDREEFGNINPYDVYYDFKKIYSHVKHHRYKTKNLRL
jgi:hypothetical protein